MQLGIFYFNIQPLVDFFSQSPLTIIWSLFSLVGYLPLVYLLIYAGLHFYVDYRQEKYVHKWKWVVLAVDVPPLNLQTPKAVEQMFSHLSGAFDSAGIAGTYRGGFKQKWFSFEIISIGGYIQFLIRTEATYRELVEAAFYAQYPEAEMTEVEDYVTGLPDTFPNKEYDIWASDFGLAENDAYPIRTYREFEHSISKDTVLKDPMGALLESFTRIGPGEQMWLQILIEPTSGSWKEKAIDKIKEILGQSPEHHSNKYLDAVTDIPLKMLVQVGDQLFGRPASEDGGHEEKKDKPQLAPGQGKALEGMENKISLIGFKTKIRGVYVAKKEVFRPERGVHALVGAFAQFNIPTANSIIPTASAGSNEQKSLFMKAYKKRKIGAPGKPFILNIEELATVWHFPMSHIKTPLVQKVQAKQSEPPVGLPIEEILAEVPGADAGPGSTPVKKSYSTDAYGYDDGMKFG